ncbi:hypothetical protein ACOMHN_034375 [Nucella lapillus]
MTSRSNSRKSNSNTTYLPSLSLHPSSSLTLPPSHGRRCSSVSSDGSHQQLHHNGHHPPPEEEEVQMLPSSQTEETIAEYAEFAA